MVFRGYAGSGFEQCKPIQGSIYSNKLYPKSSLLQLRKTSRFDFYRLHSTATFKNYPPITFDQKVRYQQTQDPNVFVIDLGTHVFYPTDVQKPFLPYKFTMFNALNEGIDEDFDDFDFKIRNQMGKTYLDL